MIAVSNGFGDVAIVVVEAPQGDEEMENQVIRIVSGEQLTPVGVATALGARVVLESASFTGGRSRYSLVITQEAFRVEQRDGVVTWSAVTGERRTLEGADLLSELRRFADQHSAPKQDFPFPAGGIGFLSYEYARYCDAITLERRKDPLGIPEALFLFAHLIVIFDHYSDLLYVVGLNYDEHQIDLEGAVESLCRRLRDVALGGMVPPLPVSPRPAFVVEEGDARWFERGVEEIQSEITAGNLLQGVLSRRVLVRGEISAMEAYRRLRMVNPAPYLVYLDFGEFQLFAASPERHVRVKEGRVMVSPIAGTRRRGEDEEEDTRLERELLSDEKERAEHLMLVDLARNDIARVCRRGSVTVARREYIERFSHVMHIVSDVTGTLGDGKTGIDALRATFPAGTVSGAPKIRAIETVDRIEGVPRGFYAGVVAYFEPGGGMDSCITIRAALKRGNQIVLQAGAGVVYDSVPEREYAETNAKLAALARAIGVEVHG